jgi:hypothetical protein
LQYLKVIVRGSSQATAKDTMVGIPIIRHTGDSTLQRK